MTFHGGGYRLKPLVSKNRVFAKQVSAAWINMICDLDPNSAEEAGSWPVCNTSNSRNVGQNLVFHVNSSFKEYYHDFRAEALQ
ncbi:hypothetical protein BJY01DRAFT_217721 [Aspergillus pseudoustus]|uniref:Uncharacterized protein n=1 Tax=Aspergillus pseudoustus TaxID=1810923 RepID=A0ABR4JQH3_9EURO